MSTSSVDIRRKTAKPLLWIGMASMAMAFAGLTSGYVVARSSLVAKGGWSEVDFPMAFYFSTAVLLATSVILHFGMKSFKSGNAQALTRALGLALLGGIAFAVLQFSGWGELIEEGLYFTGEKSTQAAQWFYVITWFHWMHILAGLLVLSTTFWQAKKGAYSQEKTMGAELAVSFWHFLDILWIYLFLFLQIVR